MTDREKLIKLICAFCGRLTLNDVKPPYGFENLADYLISNGVAFATDISIGDKWIAADQKPDIFVSVLGHMTDAGDFSAVRECYWTGDGFFFPALCERHPVDRWMEMPE